ncbi:MAG: hypothetical protein JJ900_04850 [Rhodospirillales bacterium]|nr:hypothetical protein [Rhodospirillales bacterium]MBO6786159.1 hypothetical protein [Rhodospirillales bacterium]
MTSRSNAGGENVVPLRPDVEITEPPESILRLRRAVAEMDLTTDEFSESVATLQDKLANLDERLSTISDALKAANNAYDEALARLARTT